MLDSHVITISVISELGYFNTHHRYVEVIMDNTFHALCEYEADQKLWKYAIYPIIDTLRFQLQSLKNGKNYYSFSSDKST